MFIDNISSKITELIKRNSDVSEEKAEIINYGINIFIYETLIILIIFSVAIISGYFKYILTSFLVYGILRTFAGGAHAHTRAQCLITYVTVLTSVMLISKYLWSDSFLPAIFLFILNIIILVKYAPGDTVQKPFRSKKLKSRLKFLSILATVIVYSIALIAWHSDRLLYNVIILSTIPVMFLLHPIGYKALKCQHGS
ncbi:MAG TPA: accessory gene regulator B family protein [Clostridiaceae bacterium]|nr:accessory gene regulator B family protein [Clostridiaceae bacterium]